MANICDYGIVIVGPGQGLQALSQFLMPAMLHTGRGYGEFVLDFDTLFNDLTNNEHSFIGVNGWELTTWWNTDRLDGLAEICTTMGIESDYRARWPQRNHESAIIQIWGESKWGAPMTICKRLSHKFPEVGMTVSGTTEHEYYERWIVFNGVARPITIYQDSLRGNQREWLVRDGVELDPHVIEMFEDEAPTDSA